jgi:hypothetical protein
LGERIRQLLVNAICPDHPTATFALVDEIVALETAIRAGHTLERESDGTVVVYGNPKPEHNCDEMGCPSTRHVLLVLRAEGEK